MRIVLQRVSSAKVTVDEKITGNIDSGWLVLLGVADGDSEADLAYLVDKVANLRAFPDEQGKMNLSILDTGGSSLVVSQFTLYGDCRKGRRPSFSAAAAPNIADDMYNLFCESLVKKGVKVATGVFQAHMKVELVNDGPVTFILDSNKNI